MRSSRRRHGVVHRDIKPGNIFLLVRPRNREAPRLRVAKVLWPSGAVPHTNTGAVMGTPTTSPNKPTVSWRSTVAGRLRRWGRSVRAAHGVSPVSCPHRAVATAYKRGAPARSATAERGGPTDPMLQAIRPRAAKHSTERHQTAWSWPIWSGWCLCEERERARLLSSSFARSCTRQEPRRQWGANPSRARPPLLLAILVSDRLTPPGGAAGVAASGAPKRRPIGSRPGAAPTITTFARLPGDEARRRVLPHLPGELQRELEYESMARSCCTTSSCSTSKRPR